MNRISDQVEFYYNGEEIKGTLFTYYLNNIEKSQTFMFNYKGNNIHISLEEENYWDVAPLHCEIIDKCGNEKYKKYIEYLGVIHEIKNKYIVVNEKVYDYFCKKMSDSPRYYLLNLKMSDGINLDGTYKFTDIKEKGNKRKLFKNLQNQAENYYKRNNIEPSQDQLNVSKTEIYQQTAGLINKIIKSL